MHATFQRATDERRPLSLDEIRQRAPSVFAAEARGDRSDRYAFIPTSTVLDRLLGEGFAVYAASQTRSEDREHAKHVLRLRHPDNLNLRASKDVVIPELVLTNSHDGTSAYQLLQGFYRQVCSNGLIAFAPSAEISVRHTGRVVDDVIDASFKVIDAAEEQLAVIDDYRAITLRPEERVILAKCGITVKWGEEGAPVTPESLLRPRRYDDSKPDLFSTFNVIQENLTKGGIRGRSTSGRRTTTRAIASVNEDTRINRALWQLTAELAKAKQS